MEIQLLRRLPRNGLTFIAVCGYMFVISCCKAWMLGGKDENTMICQKIMYCRKQRSDIRNIHDDHAAYVLLAAFSAYMICLLFSSA